MEARRSVIRNIRFPNTEAEEPPIRKRRAIF